MRFICFLMWVLFGACIFLSGCRAALSAGNLEFAYSIGVPGQPVPEIQEVGVDKVSDKPK